MSIADASGIVGADLRAILDASPALVVLFDREHRYRYANPSYARFIGRSVGELTGHTILEILGADIWAELRLHAELALRGRQARHAGWVPHPDGTPRYLERAYAPHLDAGGGIAGYFVIVQDTTDLKLREQELAERSAALEASEAVNAAIIASALDCVVVIDDAARVVAFNPQAERTFGYSEKEALGRPIGELIVPPHLRQRHNEGFQRYLQTGTARVLGRRIEIEAMRRDGKTFPVELTITEVSLEHRRLFTAYLRDLTEARTAAAEIEKQREALHQQEKLAALGSLLAGVAHELNNPLAIVIGQALMLQEDTGALPPAAGGIVDRASKIQTAAERCARIVRTFLAMARQRKAERRDVRLPAVIEGALDLLGYGLRSADVTIERDWPDDLPPTYADADQLHQAVVNLLINAHQAMEGQPLPRRITIRGRCENGALVVTVRDNGPGVDDAVRVRIFEPYFTTKPMGVGTGVGLAVSRGMIEAHGGTLTLLPNDPVQRGACFEIRLPLGEASPPSAVMEASTSGASIAADAYRALIIDDEPGIATMLAEILAHDGFRCDLTASGHEARRLLASAGYDAILCDLHMPGEDGPALFGWMQEHAPEAARRIVFVTGDTLGPTASRFLAECGRPVIEKPFLPADIRRMVGAIAQSSNAHSKH